MTTMDKMPVEIFGMSEWIPVSEIPTAASVRGQEITKKYGTFGVYQFARVEDLDDIGDDLIHEAIGYSGKSTDLVGRTYAARGQKGAHGVARICRQNEWDKDEVFVRYIFTNENDITDLEDHLHSESEEQFGKRFAWTEASAGRSGRYSVAIDSLTDLTFDQLCDVVGRAKDLARQKAMEDIETKLEEL